MKRREALVAMAAPLLVGFQPAAAQPTVARGILAHFLDLIIPADDVTPSASALGVHTELEDAVRSHALLSQLFDYGLSWLDQAGGRSFLTLPPETQQAILTHAAQADFNQIPGRFFAVARLLATEIYFSKSEVIAGLPLNKAPQPDGYLPPWS